MYSCDGQNSGRSGDFRTESAERQALAHVDAVLYDPCPTVKTQERPFCTSIPAEHELTLVSVYRPQNVKVAEILESKMMARSRFNKQMAVILTPWRGLLWDGGSG